MNYHKLVPFDSRDTFYKSTFGAVPEDTPFVLKVLLKNDGYVREVKAVFEEDSGDIFTFSLSDDADSFKGEFYTKSAEIRLLEGLYFYSFSLQTKDGERHLLNIGRGIGEFTPCDGFKWQLTVYDKEFKTPQWVKGGLIYQIFPDRFARAKSEQKIPKDRIIRDDWSGKPFFKCSGKKRLIGTDFFGGNLNGITEKLPYIKSLGANIIYLNPIFESQSNHRYDTSNYLKVDPVLGNEKDFENLCNEAKKVGIKIILDGVFSHTGDDSIYFNAKGRYKNLGAFGSKRSPYFKWYTFSKFPNEYNCWWGIKTLPEVNETEESYLNFITGEGGVLEYWMKKGASGFRLDVADELPDKFLDALRKRVKATNHDGFIIGEVWEDATNKISYHKRRRFLRGKQLDSVMNYPFRKAILDFVMGGSGQSFTDSIMEICENYPKPALECVMNHIGTHDTPRAITVLSSVPAPSDRQSQAGFKTTKEQYALGSLRLKAAALLSYTLPGIPSLYYGDEAGLTGFGDPFCRGTFPFGKEDLELTEFFKTLGAARKNSKAFLGTDLFFLHVTETCVVYKRSFKDSFAIVGVNNEDKEVTIPFSEDVKNLKTVFGNEIKDSVLALAPKSFALFISKRE